MEVQPHYLLVSTGRSGSSLLASILGYSGADFDLPSTTAWDPVRGSMEHDRCHRAYAYLSKIKKVKESFLPNSIFLKLYERKFQHEVMALANIPYLKSSKLVYLVPYIATKNNNIKIIVVFRPFTDYARSRHKKYAWDSQTLLDEYENAYGTALLQLSLWGGVVVNYNDLVDHSESHWATALEQLTNIPASKLLHARDELTSNVTKPRNLTEDVYETCKVKTVEKIEQQLLALSQQ